jgi:hypothetical protein
MLLTALAIAAHAASVPTLIHYQGRFTDTAGEPLADPVNLEFRIYAEPAGGTPLWTEAHGGVALRDGVAELLLGGATVFPEQAFAAPVRYMEIRVNGEALTPRLVVASVPFAMEADRLDGMDAADFDAAGAAAAVAGALAVSDGTPPNEGSNRVQWDNLAGVPEGFADGLDDGGSGGSDPVTGADVTDSTLTGADLAPRTLEAKHVKTRTLTGNEVALETITGDNILDDSVRSADVRDATLTGVDVKNGSLTADDLADSTVTSLKIANHTILQEDLAFPAGDITGVISGSGLTGGGISGSVTLSVVPGAGLQLAGSAIGLAPSYFSGSAYDPRFVLQSLPTFQPQAGNVVVAGCAFHPATPTGTYTVRPGLGYVFVDDVANAGAENEFTAPVQLPHGATITGFFVTYWDNSAGFAEVALWRARVGSGQVSKLASVQTGGELPSWTTGNDVTIAETDVENADRVYWLTAVFPDEPQGENLRLLAVRVSYTITRPY